MSCIGDKTDATDCSNLASRDFGGEAPEGSVGPSGFLCREKKDS